MWLPPPLHFRKEVVVMSTYQALSLMIGFGMLLITLISYLDRDKSNRK